jgi:hypothetical protein
MGSADPVHTLERSAITPLVRRAMHSPAVEVSDWSVYPIHSGDGEGLGVYRFVGIGEDQGKRMPWSLVLKAFEAPAQGGRVGDWNYWKREAMAYRSGLLNDLPGGMAAPRCLGVEELAEGIVRLWLEDVVPANEAPWSLDRYALAARHLGQLNGAYLVERSLPDAPWLSTNWLRGWMAANEAAMEHLKRVLDHTLVRQVYPEGVARSFLRLWTERELFLDQLDRLPPTLCHLDAFRRNLLDRRLSDGSEQTLALDWAFVGRGALGEELGPLISASIEFFEAGGIPAQELEEAAFQGYLDGLAEAGWRGDPRVVRFGYAASTALRYGVGTVRLVLPVLLDEQFHARVEELLGHPKEEVFEKWAEGTRHIVPLTEEAHQLADVLHP